MWGSCSSRYNYGFDCGHCRLAEKDHLKRRTENSVSRLQSNFGRMSFSLCVSTEWPTRETKANRLTGERRRLQRPDITLLTTATEIRQQQNLDFDERCRIEGDDTLWPAFNCLKKWSFLVFNCLTDATTLGMEERAVLTVCISYVLAGWKFLSK